MTLNLPAVQSFYARCHPCDRTVDPADSSSPILAQDTVQLLLLYASLTTVDNTQHFMESPKHTKANIGDLANNNGELARTWGETLWSFLRQRPGGFTPKRGQNSFFSVPARFLHPLPLWKISHAAVDPRKSCPEKIPN